MPETFTSASAPELAVIERNGFIESRHSGAAVVMAPNGDILHALGDIDTPIFARSTLKPFQAIASMRAGAQLSGVTVALACASHVAQIEHMDVVEDMLSASGLTTADLQCPLDWPQDEDARNYLVRKDMGKQRIAYNCSGKHAAFLAACVKNNWPTIDYLAMDHPLKRKVAEVIEEFTEENITHWGIDGCGAPLAAVSLRGLANATRKLALAPRALSADARAATVARAMLDYPWAVHGRGRENTVVMEQLGVIAKGGAEGVLILGAPDGTSVALKMLDGAHRATSLVGLALLVAVGAIDSAKASAVLEQVVPKILGGGVPVGRILLAPAVTDLLDAASKRTPVPHAQG